jgi:quercetin dioxygenase-like cupin family protein
VLDAAGVALRFVCGPRDTRGAWSLIENLVPVGAGPPPHHHPWDEAYFVIEGEVEFRIGDSVLRVRAGDFAYAPANTVHAFHGVSEAPARMLVFDAPAHAEAFFRDVDRELRRTRDVTQLPAIGDRHGVQFLPPAAG